MGLGDHGLPEQEHQGVAGIHPVPAI